MKASKLKPLTPIRSTLLPWNSREVLPPEKPRHKNFSAAQKLDMPTVFTVVLVDLISQDVVLNTGKLSKGKARKAILAGKVWVNGEVVHDPDMRVEADDKVEFFA